MGNYEWCFYLTENGSPYQSCQSKLCQDYEFIAIPMHEWLDKYGYHCHWQLIIWESYSGSEVNRISSNNLDSLLSLAEMDVAINEAKLHLELVDLVDR